MAWIGAAISAVGALAASSGASEASDSQSQASEAAVAEQRRQYDQTRTDLAPYRNTGGAAVGRIGELLGLPGYERESGYGSDAWMLQNILPQIRQARP
jgi:hypothetical protein